MMLIFISSKFEYKSIHTENYTRKALSIIASFGEQIYKIHKKMYNFYHSCYFQVLFLLYLIQNTKKDTNNEEYYNIDVKILSGKFKGQLITTQNYFNENANHEKNNIQSLIRVGDEVLISIDEDLKGNIANAYIYDIVRYKYMYELAAEILKALAGSIGLVVTIPIIAIVSSTLIVTSYEKCD